MKGPRLAAVRTALRATRSATSSRPGFVSRTRPPHAYICVATFVSARYALPSGVTSAAAGRSRFEQK